MNLYVDIILLLIEVYELKHECVCAGFEVILWYCEMIGRYLHGDNSVSSFTEEQLWELFAWWVLIVGTCACSSQALSLHPSISLSNKQPQSSVTSWKHNICCWFSISTERRSREISSSFMTQMFDGYVLLPPPPLLAGRPAAALRPLQLIQKPAAPLVFNLSSLTLLRSLHWLPVAARICFKTLALGTVLWQIGSSPHPGHGQTLHPRSSTPLCIDQSAAPSLRGTAVTQQHLACFLSRLLNGGTSSTWINTSMNSEPFVLTHMESQHFSSSWSKQLPHISLAPWKPFVQLLFMFMHENVFGDRASQSE